MRSLMKGEEIQVGGEVGGGVAAPANMPREDGFCGGMKRRGKEVFEVDGDFKEIDEPSRP